MIADRRPIAASLKLANEVALGQRTVVADNCGRTNHRAVRMVNHQSFPDYSLSGNLSARKERVPVRESTRKWFEPMSIEPAAQSVKNHRLQAEIKKNNGRLSHRVALFVGQSADIRSYIFEHSVKSGTSDYFGFTLFAKS